LKTPEGFELVGGEIDRWDVSLRIAGPDLDPDLITARLGVQPSFAARKGDKRERKAGSTTQPIGIWSVGLPNSREWELSDAIAALLNRLPAEIAVWDEIATLAKIDMFCGLFSRSGIVEPSCRRSCWGAWQSATLLWDWTSIVIVQIATRTPNKRLTLSAPFFCGGHLFVNVKASRCSLSALR
jgi:hypothetical protein